MKTTRIITLSILFRMKNILDKDCRENNFFLENRGVYEITWKNIVERGRSQNMRHA
jgi:hypothetical protein